LARADSESRSGDSAETQSLYLGHSDERPTRRVRARHQSLNPIERDENDEPDTEES
jgi:hypothetical protein